MKNGFTLLEMISIIIILSVIAILSFSSMTKTIKKIDTEELSAYEDAIKNSCSVYIESFINEHFLNGTNREEIMLTTLMDEKFINRNLGNPTDCSTENIVVIAKKESNKTISYKVRCLIDGTYSELKKAS